MRDDEIRELERDKDESPKARAAWLHALVDSGRIEDVHVQALAYAGDEGARIMTEPKPPNALAWTIGLWDYGQRPAVAAIVAMVADALEQKGAKITGKLAEILRDALSKANQDELNVTMIGETISAAGNVMAFQFAALRMHEVDERRMVEKGKAAVVAWALSGGDMGPTLALILGASEDTPDPAMASAQGPTVTAATTAAFMLVGRRVIEAMGTGTSPEAFAEDLRSSMPWAADWIASFRPDMVMAMLGHAAHADAVPEDMRRIVSELASRLESHPNWLDRAIVAMAAGSDQDEAPAPSFV